MEDSNVEFSGERIVLQKIKDKAEKPFRLSELKLKNIKSINERKNDLYKNIKESERIYQNQEMILSKKTKEEYTEIAKKCYENAGIEKFSYNEVEEWKTYMENPSNWRAQYKEIKKVEVSNWGRVRFKKASGIHIQKQVDKKNNGYLELDGYPSFPVVYKMVAETWLSKDEHQDATLREWHVHHISNNGYDQRPENLIWLRSSLHKFIHSN